jgi:ornithine cyclodeaminase
MSTAPDLVVIPGHLVADILRHAHPEAKRLVEDVYIQSSRGRLVNPESLFLRPDPEARERVIALPAYVPEPVAAMGVKWIASFPENLRDGLPRASATILLNDTATGFPVAVLEGARISACRTALSALVGADALAGEERRARKFAVLGTGYISATTVRAFLADGWEWSAAEVFDLSADRAGEFVKQLAEDGFDQRMTVAATAGDALRDADLVLLATTAVTPHLDDLGMLAPSAVVLHMSLRDLAPQALTGADHVVDDVSHALRERTSIALAVEAGLVAVEDVHPVGDLLTGAWQRPAGRTAVYAPFGLGSLDIALATLVLERSRALPGATVVADFAGLRPPR